MALTLLNIPSAEKHRLDQDASRKDNWKRWGPYLSERQWGTVREDYSPDGTCWDYFPHDHARSRAYRWGEDGLMGICDRQGRLCFALALWNGKDPILKERLFGLTGPEGNHGEDVKECYYYLDSTPTHSYMKALYKYPQEEYPYARLLEESRRRSVKDPEYELEDSGIFEDNRYFDIYAEYAKGSSEDILIKITVANRGAETAKLHLLPTLWYRNTWIWGCTHEGCTMKPRMELQPDGSVLTDHQTLGRYWFEADRGPDGKKPQLLFTENETNTLRLYGTPNYTPYVKDAFHRYLVNSERDAICPRAVGTKLGAYYQLEVPAHGEQTVCLRLYADKKKPDETFGNHFSRIFKMRQNEADEFYKTRISDKMSQEERNVARQCYAGLLWTKQFYHYVVEDWINGDPSMPAPPESRKHGRNNDWRHLFNKDVISMPDKWEYPWYAAWDLAFHMIPFSKVDPHFAKEQLLLFLREWYMHPNGQIPAYEFAFGDVNPPVHAWACWRVYKMTGPKGQRDRLFLSRCFQKLLMNFTWWVNRKDIDGKHIFAGGFLGLDNIGVFDRSRPLPTGGRLEQADGTAWMAFYCVTMLDMALELALEDPSYEDIASKFFEHFVAITDAMNRLGGTGLWDEGDGFYYDKLLLDHCAIPLRIRSMVGLIPLYACLVLEHEVIQKLPGFRSRLKWFLDNRKDLAQQVSYMDTRNKDHFHHLLAIPSRERLERVLKYLLDENEFFSPYGIRSLSKYHEQHPYVFSSNGAEYRVQYVPGESDTYLFGGNSNWRGPVWYPVNYLIMEALERYYFFYGDSLKVECPTGSGHYMNLKEVSLELARRLTVAFLPDEQGRRPCHGEVHYYTQKPDWKDLLLFHEYFHSDTGRGVGANHQTGWTSLVVRCLDKYRQ